MRAATPFMWRAIFQQVEKKISIKNNTISLESRFAARGCTFYWLLQYNVFDAIFTGIGEKKIKLEFKLINCDFAIRIEEKKDTKVGNFLMT